ncbi:MAG: exosortase/archaeosortase family protein [Deltaproteobacteria bacterium]|nr:exosortase/archaeosortase family protein [Deltaproteobacteria bacterium]
MVENNLALPSRFLRWLAARSPLLPPTLALTAIILTFLPGLRWLVSSWTDMNYGSSGYLALPLIALFWRRLPQLRDETRRGALWAAVAVVALEFFLAPLGIHLVMALLAILALHLWSFAFFQITGRWYAQPQLYLGLATLPVAHWGNVLFGFHLQHAVTRIAGGVLRLYGAAVQVEGTLLRFPSMVVAVDESCSGIRLIIAALIFGLLASPRHKRVFFWLLLLLAVFVANVSRVVTLALLHLWLGGPPTDAIHQGIGLSVFALACGSLLWFWRRPKAQGNAEEQAA